MCAACVRFLLCNLSARACTFMGASQGDGYARGAQRRTPCSLSVECGAVWTLRCARAAPLRVSTAPAHSGAAPALRAGGLRPASAGSVQRNMVGFLLPHRLQPFEPCSREPRSVTSRFLPPDSRWEECAASLHAAVISVWRCMHYIAWRTSFSYPRKLNI